MPNSLDIILEIEDLKKQITALEEEKQKVTQENQDLKSNLQMLI